jgi:nifR3 family TIM-barrel protein
MRIGDITIDPPFVLAPMASITNPPFRQVCLEHGAGLTCSEMLSAHQLVHRGGPRLIERCPGERVLVVQLYGRVPRMMADAARLAIESGADVVDINMGCPAQKVVSQGAGVALMREPDLAVMIARAVVAAVPVPVTVKMRAGFSAGERNAAEMARAVVEAGIRAVTVHARVREAVHTGPVDWDVIRRVRDVLPPDVTVVGNGGVTSPDDSVSMRASTGCDGGMVGRGARGNPWLFTGLARGEAVRPTAAELHRVLLRHFDLYVAWGGEDRAVREMRKHLCWYLRGVPRASVLRGALGGLRSSDDVVRLVDEVMPRDGTDMVSRSCRTSP